MDEPPLSPATALHLTQDAAAKIRRAGRWRFLAWFVIVTFFTALNLLDRVIANPPKHWSLVLLAVTVTILVVLSWRAKVFDKRMDKVEAVMLSACVVVGVISTALFEWVLPDSVTVWTYLVGLSTYLPYLGTLWWILRR